MPRKNCLHFSPRLTPVTAEPTIYTITFDIDTNKFLVNGVPDVVIYTNTDGIINATTNPVVFILTKDGSQEPIPPADGEYITGTLTITSLAPGRYFYTSYTDSGYQTSDVGTIIVN